MSAAKDPATATKPVSSIQLSDKNESLTHPHAAGRTLLPRPLAALVSTVTGASSLSLKVGTKIGGWWIAGARETTLAGLELSRAAVEALLNVAGRDVSQRSGTELGRAEAESTLERAISAFHSTISTVSFFAAAGFYASSASLNSVSAISIQGLAMLNAILGSTESSRAVAAIVTLMKEELNRQDPDSRGEVISYFDLFSGTISFVLLQRWGRRKTELDFREAGGEEIIWDTVIDDKGFRAEVVGTKREYPDEVPTTSGATDVPLRFLSETGDEEFEAAAIHLTSDDQTQLSECEIRDRILSQLPYGARAVITSETFTAKSIKVDIYDAETTHIEPPPGTIIVAERLNHDKGHKQYGGGGVDPHQTVIFRTALRRSRSTEIESGSRLRLTVNQAEQPDAGDEDPITMHHSPLRTPQEPCSENSELGTKQPTAPVDDLDYHNPAPLSGTVPIQETSRNPRLLRPDMPEDESEKPGKIPRATNGKQNNSSSKIHKSGTSKKVAKPLVPQSLSPSQSVATLQQTDGSQSRGQKSQSPNRVLASNIPRMTPKKIQNTPLKLTPQSSSSRSYNGLTNPSSLSPSLSRTSTTQAYFTVQENHRDSSLSQTDTYSIHSCESRPGSPNFTRSHICTTNGLTRTRSEVDIGGWSTENLSGPEEHRHHRRSHSFVPSLYSMTTKDAQEAIILAPKTPIPRRSLFEDQQILTALISDGVVPGVFPQQHLVRTVRRFSRFASASYGSNFLRIMGLASSEKAVSTSSELMTLDVHHEHSSFSSHTGLPPDTILLSSFVDPEGATGNVEWSPSAISPLIHFISIDRDSKAVVLTCRGTLGFEDVLTDMTCDYDDLYWQGRPYRVHKGIHASAKRLLGGGGSRVMATIRATLEEYPDFGLVLCGHSLGGAVAALVAILISEPAKDAASDALFVTAPAPKLLSSSAHDSTNATIPPITLPSGRPIHVYSYGTPATISPSLRIATRGLITTVVNSSDIVPSLSLGTLHDFRAVALHLKVDKEEAYEKLKTRVKKRIWHALQSAFYVDSGPPPAENTAGDGVGEDTWAWSALKTLRASMTNDKLVPPGEVFVVETTRVFDRQQYAPTSAAASRDTAGERVVHSLGRPSTRVQFKFISDVETRFGELRFGRDMFSDHSPGRYEASLAALEKGILGR